MKAPDSNKPRWSIVFEGTALIAGGIPFLIFGGVACRNGAWPFGTPFVTLGLIALTWGIVHVFRGNRLGVQIKGDSIVVYPHFGAEVIPFRSIKRISRAEDVTVLVLESGQKRIDDSFFVDAKARDFFLTQLVEACPETPIHPSSS